MQHPDLPLFDATVIACDVDTPHVTRLRVELADPQSLASFTTPGQYVALAPEGHPARWYVIASRPSDLPALEFVIGRGAPIPEALCALGPGGRVRVSDAQGQGYPMARLRGRPLVAFVSGTGIAAVAPVVDALLEEQGGAGIHVYQQERVREEDPDAGSPCAFPLQSALARWRSAGVRTVQACDASPVGPSAWVEALWGADPDRPDPGSCEYIICGNAELEERVGAALAAAGVLTEQLHRNY